MKAYIENTDKQVLIIVVDGRIDQQRLHISFLRQLIDNTDQSINKSNESVQKYFLILVHSTSQELNHQSCFPAIFLHNWDYYFLDTSTSGSAFHLQKILQLLPSSYQTNDDEQFEPNNNFQQKNVQDYNQLFHDCLWDFCSRLRVSLENLPKHMFTNALAEEFYQQHTSTHRRFQCLQAILEQSVQLQERIINIYYENMTINQKTFDKMKLSMYQLSKDVICGKRTNSLVDSFESQTRAKFIYFISNILKNIVIDYGLETLSKFSDDQYGYGILLNLIDYSSLAINDEDENELLTANQGGISLRNNNSHVLETPLYNLLYQRIKTLAEQIKPKKVAEQQRDDFDMEPQISQSVFGDDDDDYNDDGSEFFGGKTTTMDSNQYRTMENDEPEPTEYTSEQFRDQLIESILNDRTLVEIISEPILKSYTDDTVRIFCSVVEESFKSDQNNANQHKKTIEFVADWLLLIDQQDQQNLENSPNQIVWRLADVYTYFKYEPNDLLSLYSACRTLDQLDPNQSIYENISADEFRTRASVRESIFRKMFDSLWSNLSDLCSNNESPQSWIQSYTFISKYYPSEKVLEHQRLTNIKGELEFMSLAYLIFLNNQTPKPKELIQQLLNENRFNDNYNFGTSICLNLLPNILNTIEHHLQNENLQNSTLMIDVQQWILIIVNSSKEPREQDMKTILKFLNQPNCQLSLSMKQFLFDEIMNLLLKTKQNDRGYAKRENTDFWERITLLPTVVSCVTEPNLQTYKLPYHPSVITDENQKQILFDLFFFHLRRSANEGNVSWQLLNTILMSSTPTTRERNLQPAIERVFQQLKDFFAISLTASLFSEKESIKDEQNRLNQVLNAVIQRYLTLNAAPITELSSNLQLFLSTVITKRSWTYLLNLLKSERFQDINSQWSNTLHDLLQIQQTQQNKSLQTCHRLEFTLTTNTNLSIFPKLHQPYDELAKIVVQCSKVAGAQRWQPLVDWITTKLTTNPLVINATEIKVMLLLNIYYDYYCTNQLATLKDLMAVIEGNLQPLDQEKRVFKVFLEPKKSMIGYPPENDNGPNSNRLNDLFTLDCRDEDELGIRHTLVNLLAMILLAGKENFLWTFTFEPLTLQNTLGKFTK